MKLKVIFPVFTVIAALMFAGCRTNHMPPANPNKSDLTAEQKGKLSARKMHVPCRIEVHCPASLVGDRSSIFSCFDHHFHYYPLQDILRNSFQSAAYSVFDQPGSEVIDAFTIYITVPESRLNVSGDEAEYFVNIIVTLNEPGEKKITAWSLSKRSEAPFFNENEVPPVIYEVCRDIAYETMMKLIKNPKVLRTVKRFEDR
jgi:hypothetical protein